MRQTEEHLEILELLGIMNGVVAITKADLVDEEWMMMVEEEVKERLSSTILAGSPIIPVSSVTGFGLDRLTSALEAQVDKASERAAEPASRLYIDRAFNMTGQGVVVTGTLLGGDVAEGSRLELMPGGFQVKVKRLEVHDSEVAVACRGQRVAMNLAGTDKQQVERGMVLVNPGWLTATTLIDTECVMLECASPVEHNQRLRLHIGTLEVLARARVPKQAHDGRIFLQLETEGLICPARGDRFVLRSYSPQTTLAGGRVIMTDPPRRKIGTEQEASGMAELAGEPYRALAELIRCEARKAGFAALPQEPDKLRRIVYMAEEGFSSAIEEAILKESLIKLEGEGFLLYLDKASYDKSLDALLGALTVHHKEHPMRKGMPREEARQKVLPGLDRKLAQAIFSSYAKQGLLALSGEHLALMDHKVALNTRQEELAERMTELFLNAGMSPPDFSASLQQLGKEAGPVSEYLVDEGVLVKATPDVVFHKETVIKAIEVAGGFGGAFTAAMLRDALGTSRKYAIALLEWMDASDLTQRSGDTRTLRKK